MPRTHAPYPPEFRHQMVELVRTGRPIRDIARDFECHEQTIRNWIRQADLDEGRRVVGWSMANQLRTELVLEALNMALWQRRPGSVVHHSDQGSQYTSYAFGKRCREMGVAPSMGSVGDCFDNAMAESFFATLECELIDRRVFRTQAEAHMAIFEYIEGWYNPHRRHSGLGYLSPLNFERSNQQAA